MRSRKAGLRPAPSPRPVTVVAPAVSPVPSPVHEPDEAAFDAAREPLEPLEPLRSSGFQQFGTVLGGVIAGIEEQVFGRKPPGEVQVRQAQPTRGLTGEGTEVTLHFPDPEHEDEPPDRG